MSVFKKLFRRKQEAQPEASLDIPTLPIPREETAAAETALPEIEPALISPSFVFGCCQSVGKSREHNEDALFTLTSNLSTDQTYIPIGLYVVADGMGGHQQGEVASGIAVRVLGSQVFSKIFTSLLNPDPAPPQEAIQEIMQSGVQEAHQAILKYAPGSGTTLTGVLLLNDQMTIVHVGDSRAYSVAPDGKLTALTRDHSLVMRMIELGHLSTEEAAVHPQRNVLYRALGQGEPFLPDIGTFPIPKSGHLLICSDGLWGVVPETQLAEIILQEADPQTACEKMVTAANQAGGPDNITVILIRLPDRD